jgi:hypothetical protein
LYTRAGHAGMNIIYERSDIIRVDTAHGVLYCTHLIHNV